MNSAKRFPLLVLIVASSSLVGLLGGPERAPAQEAQEKFTNLKVFPKDVSPRELRSTMSAFTRALGVRCSYCHVAKPGQPIRHEDFALDDKPEKKTARVMMEMTRDLNEKYLARLEDRSDPPIKVQCFTCHRGTAHPQTLQDALVLAYAKGGLDSTRARYAGLRDRYYGRAAYDFGEVPLADVASTLADSGHVADAANLLALNVEMNPQSAFAQRQYAAGSVLLAFTAEGGDSGTAVYQRMKDKLGQPGETEFLIGGIGHRLLLTGKTESALAAFKLNTAEHPQSGDAFADLGEVYVKRGDKKLAIESYLKAAALDTANTDVVKQLELLKVSKSKIAKARGRK